MSINIAYILYLLCPLLSLLIIIVQYIEPKYVQLSLSNYNKMNCVLV